MLPLAFAVLTQLAQAASLPPSRFNLSVDSAGHRVSVRSRVECSAPSIDGSTHHHSTDAHLDSWQQFRWPVDGWLRGFRLVARDLSNRILPATRIHHLVLANLDRRQLVHPAVERLLAIGSETEDVLLPQLVGVPLRRGARLALKVACHAVTPAEHEIWVALDIAWTSLKQAPHPTSVFPFYVDVHLQSVLEMNTFDVPPGRSSTSYQFSIPLEGRLLAAGAHLHDHGLMVQLEDAATGSVISRLRAKRDLAGKVVSIERKLYGVSGRGLRLRANHRYRLVAWYDNPSDSTIKNGGMAHLVGLFQPADPGRWPPIDTTIVELREDMRRVEGDIQR